MGALGAHGTPIRSVKRGDIIGFQDEPDIILRVLNPGSDDLLKGDSATLVHDKSIAVRVEYGSISILLAGNIEKGAETNMLSQASGQLSSQALKVADYGSDNATSPDFIGAVRPQVSIISVGANNKSGYPSPATIERLHSAGSQIYRTDQDGTVEITAEKDRFWARSER